MLRSASFFQKGVLDQWGLIHVGLFAVRSVAGKLWTNSFHACNMDPRTMVPFPEWCKKIEHFLQAGQSFKSEEPAQLYRLLPSVLHGMTPAEKSQMVAMIEVHGGEVSVDLCKALRSECSIPFKDQHSMFVAYNLAKKQAPRAHAPWSARGKRRSEMEMPQLRWRESR
jgi:hypothetical protein